jgi:hypothetical protein
MQTSLFPLPHRLAARPHRVGNLGVANATLIRRAQLWVDGAAEQAGAGAEAEAEADRGNRAKGKTATRHEHNQAR